VEDKEKATSIIIEEFYDALSDVNVSCMVVACYRAEEDAKAGLVPGLTRERFLGRPPYWISRQKMRIPRAQTRVKMRKRERFRHPPIDTSRTTEYLASFLANQQYFLLFPRATIMYRRG
jgi:hypothetical protein